jgi:predicted nucleotidyltransferase component of viral defense system
MIPAQLDLNYMSPATRELFVKLAGMTFMKRFTLVGGTGLSIQIAHRISEDLDFIFDGEKLPLTTIQTNILKNFPTARIIRKDYVYQVDFVVDTVKLTFFCSNAVMVLFPVQKFAFTYKNLFIAHISTIAVLKLGTIAEISTIRDYYDLYMLAKHHIPMSKIIDQTKQLLPNLSPITYSETLIYTADIEEESISEHLSPTEKVTKQEIATYFVAELKKILKP